ncbi:MAG TPA: glycoside hydrolase family 88 protein [Terracidiphilus sp.]|nr:glycoside hydrolase family 88 protein [Terracidiphilus sp.]
MNKSSAVFCLSVAGMLALTAAIGVRLHAQAPADDEAGTSQPATVQSDPSGDDAAEPGPLARDLSPAIKSPAIQKAMRKVADWQLATAESRFSTDWTYAALYDGLLAASRATGDPRYHNAVLKFAETNGWRLGPRFAMADDEAVAQAYLELYREHPEPQRIAAIKEEADQLLQRQDDPQKDLWWWCDALFMAPPALARLTKATGDARYLDYMDREWWITSGHLYDPAAHLYSRDASYLNRHEKNGAKLFWSRGNGWVLAGLARVIPYLPEDYPGRARYIEQFRQMAREIASIQGEDGLWRSGLLDAGAYPRPEVSGSAFFTFALAWGINSGLLDRSTYEPLVAKAWKGLLGHIYADGRLGSMQRIGGAPSEVSPGGSYVYGVGAFLLAGSEVDKLAEHRYPAHRHSSR